MVDDDRVKRDAVVRSLNQMPGVTCAPPQGTIYAFADVSATGRPSQALAEELLEEARVVVEAASFYGAAGEGYLPICFGSVSHEQLQEAMRRMIRLFPGIHK